MNLRRPMSIAIRPIPTGIMPAVVRGRISRPNWQGLALPLVTAMQRFGRSWGNGHRADTVKASRLTHHGILPTSIDAVRKVHSIKVRSAVNIAKLAGAIARERIRATTRQGAAHRQRQNINAKATISSTPAASGRISMAS